MNKKVLHIRSSAGVFGAENVIIELGKHSREYGYHPIIGAIKVEDDPYPEFLNIAKDLNIDTVLFEGKGRLDLQCVRRMREYVRHEGVRVLHCHGYKEDLYGMLLPGDMIKVATNHLWKRLFLRGKLNALVDSVSLRFFDKVVGVSDGVIDDMKRHFIRNTIKIPNGIDTDNYSVEEKSAQMLEKFSLRPDMQILGMVSSLTYEKGHAIAFRVLKNILQQYPDVRLLVVGDGKMKQELKDRAASLGLSGSIIFAGKQRKIREILSIIDIFLLPSFVEGLPMALLEAMSSGKAVIATTVGENMNVIDQNRSGILVAPGSEGELEDAIRSLLERPDQIGMLGSNARDVVKNRYAAKVMTQKYCELYDALAAY